MKRNKLFGIFNIVDILLILIVIIVGIVGGRMLSRIERHNASALDESPQYQVPLRFFPHPAKSP